LIGHDTGIKENRYMSDAVISSSIRRVYRLEDDKGYGPVPRNKFKTSAHSTAIQRLLRDLNRPPWLRKIVGCKSLFSAGTHRDDWVFGITMLDDLRKWTRSWLGKGCVLSVYDVPQLLVVEGEGEVMFWRGTFQLAPGGRVGRSHPSGLAPVLQDRISEPALIRLLEGSSNSTPI